MSKQPFPVPFMARTLAVALLASCTYSDPGYNELLTVADPQPRKDAIVGMWTRSYPGSVMVDKHSITEMYRSDGTGLWSYRSAPSVLTPLAPVLAPDRAKKLTWTPNGNGGWNVSHEGGYTAECRIAKGKLLQKRVVVSGVMYWVFDPVSPH